MSKRAGAIAILIFAAVFLLVNRAAYKGYFQDDDLDTLAWAPAAPVSTFVEGALTPRFFPNNFRPVGHFFYREAGRWFGLDFPKYVAVLQLFHLLNVWLVWMVARKLGAPPAAALLGCVFFGFHMALFDAFWKPMYVFDLLCGTFCLLALLFWAQRRWLLSFAAFWLAYKAKELAVMLPLALACYEYWLGKRQWKLLIPFFAASLCFGLQGMLLNPNSDNDYTFRFTWAALRRTGTYYAGRVFLVPYLGLLAPLAVLTGRNRRTWFGLALAAILFFPLLFLPGRVFSPYCYVPFTGLALALSGVAESAGPIPVAVFLLCFAPFDLRELRERRSATLALDNEVRSWVTPVADFARSAPQLDGVVYCGQIPGFARWGEEGAIHYLWGNDGIKVAAGDVMQLPRVAYIVWNPGLHRTIIDVREPGTPDAGFIDFDRNAPVWQLERGWFDLEGGFRWTAPTAMARLAWPAGARRFTIRLLVGAARLQAVGPVTLRVWLNERELEPRRLDTAGWQYASWDVGPAGGGAVEVKLEADPPFQPSAEGRKLGIAVGAMGFVSGSTP